jgi:hypothetical protein
MVAAGFNLDVAIEHGANPERVDCAHGVDRSTIEANLVAGYPVAEWIGTHEPLTVDDHKIASPEVIEERPNSSLGQAGSMGETGDCGARPSSA